MLGFHAFCFKTPDNVFLSFRSHTWHRSNRLAKRKCVRSTVHVLTVYFSSACDMTVNFLDAFFSIAIFLFVPPFALEGDWTENKTKLDRETHQLVCLISGWVGLGFYTFPCLPTLWGSLPLHPFGLLSSSFGFGLGVVSFSSGFLGGLLCLAFVLFFSSFEVP